MSEDPQARFEENRVLDPAIEDAGRRGLTGTARANLYDSHGGAGPVSLPPDGKPLAEQPRWRRDFAIDWPEDHHVARRDFAQFLVLTSGAFVAGQTWIAARSLVRHRRSAPGRQRIASVADLPVRSVTMFDYPGEHDPCLLVRLADDRFVAFSQKCTHLSCAVVPEVESGVFRCPCHEGYFDLETGRNIAGPPPRPLPRIELEVRDGEVYAVGVEARVT
jgi:Rieske Fe-S protein